MQAIGVQKSRKPKFDFTFHLQDLNNIPYVSGSICVKWHLSGASGHHDDRSTKAIIKDHKALFDYEKTINNVKLTIDKNNWLQEAIFSLEIIHEVKINGKDERSLLGVVRINLAEYVEASRLSEDPITRRFLLHESKINSTIRLAIRLVQTDGERNFMAPQLRSAPQFVGIAGVMAAEHIAEEESGPTAIALDPLAKEAGDELRELYKKTLAAELTCQPGDPSADQVIEDIFAGGDGWGSVRNVADGSDTTSSGRRAAGGGGGGGDGRDGRGSGRGGGDSISRRDALDDDAGGNSSRGGGNWSDGEDQSRPVSRSMRNGGKKSWPDFHHNMRRLQERHHTSRESLNRNDDSEQYRLLSSKRSFGQASQRTDLTDREYVTQVPDVDELDVREDLRCWISRPHQ